MSKKDLSLFDVFKAIFRMWKRETFRRVFANRKIIVNLLKGKRRRERTYKREGLKIPTALAISPTERCNLQCLGCYSRAHPRTQEISKDVLDTFLTEAIDCGVSFFVITGGEPFLRNDMADFFETHNRGLFLVVTNGTKFDPDSADKLAACKNVIPVLSLEGNKNHTDTRRGGGVYESVFQSMELFRERNVIFGFSVVCTKNNIDYLGSYEFINGLAHAGCTFGFFNELIPIEQEDLGFLPSKEQSETFQKKLSVLRKEKPVVLIDLPRDEYDENGRCMAVGRGAMHINAQGWVEPCPFAHYARENINTHSFREIVQSPFLQAIREHPTVLQHGEIGCSLVSNKTILEDIVKETGARKTSAAAGISPSALVRS